MPVNVEDNDFYISLLSNSLLLFHPVVAVTASKFVECCFRYGTPAFVECGFRDETLFEFGCLRSLNVSLDCLLPDTLLRLTYIRLLKPTRR